MASQEKAIRRVIVDVRVWLGGARGSAAGLDLDAPCYGGLLEWIRLSGGAWAARVNVSLTYTDGQALRIDNQLIPARALRPFG